MQDSDDYFTDDLVLNDEDLAALDEEEQKFALALTQMRPTASPPTKRQKTEDGWKPGRGNHNLDTREDLEDLPEISVQGDGTYGIGSSRHGNARLLSIQEPRVIPPPSRLSRGNSRVSSGSSSPILHSARVESIPLPLAIRSSSSGPRQSIHIPHEQYSSTSSSRLRVAQVQSQQPAPPAFQHVTTPGVQSPQQNDAEIEALRRQIKELHKENLKIQADLKDAMNIRFSKEGEVTILRKGMERTAQDHAAQVAKLKAAREEADAKQALMQKEMKEEMERLRTQFTFKQHELETSSRKPPGSVRAARISKEPPPTPLNIPSQMRGWNLPDNARTGSSKPFGESPQRTQVFATIAKESPKDRGRRKQTVTGSIKKPVALPGFQNSFMPTSPIVSKRPNVRGKGKVSTAEYRNENGMDQMHHLASKHLPSSLPSSPIGHKHATQEINVRMSNDIELAGDEIGPDNMDGFGDMQMDGSYTPSSPPSEDFEEIEAPSWKDELNRIILTHSLSPCAALTLQLLMNVSLPTSPTDPSGDVYLVCTSRVFEILSNASVKLEIATRVISESLTEMLSILNINNIIPPMTALLNLLTHLVYFVPSFLSALLSHSQHAVPQQSPAMVTSVLCSIIRTHCLPVNGSRDTPGDDSDRKSITNETFGLMESLCWNTPDEFQERLAPISCGRRIFSIILDPMQPTWLISRGTRLLVFLATYPALSRYLLCLADQDSDTELANTDSSKLPHIERLCLYLTDTERHGEEAVAMRSSILTFLAMISVSYVDGISILLESQALIPSLVVFLAQSATPFWECDEPLMSSRAAISSSIRITYQTLLLLHRLIFGTEPVYNLQQKLNQATQTSGNTFNGVVHMFIVTFGRLAYADCPEWVDHDGRDELEQVAEMAQSILDLVVEGPESDLVYAAFQDTDDHKSTTDDEEMEARLLDANDM